MQFAQFNALNRCTAQNLTTPVAVLGCKLETNVNDASNNVTSEAYNKRQQRKQRCEHGTSYVARREASEQSEN